MIENRIALSTVMMLFSVTALFAQNKDMDNKVVKIKSLGKKAIIQMAYNVLGERTPPIEIIPEDFEITALANSKTVLVKFRRLIRYVPINHQQSDFAYDLSVNIITKKVSPLDDFMADNFYMPTKEDQERIAFVKQAFGLPREGFDNTVHETKDTYQIDIDNEVAFGRYVIDKITGKEVVDALEGSYEPAPFPDEVKNEDPYIEINE